MTSRVVAGELCAPTPDQDRRAVPVWTDQRKDLPRAARQVPGQRFSPGWINDGTLRARDRQVRSGLVTEAVGVAWTRAVSALCGGEKAPMFLNQGAYRSTGRNLPPLGLRLQVLPDGISLLWA